MAYIRRKIEDNPAEPHYNKTEVRVGYRMIEPLLSEMLIIIMLIRPNFISYICYM